MSVKKECSPAAAILPSSNGVACPLLSPDPPEPDRPNRLRWQVRPSPHPWLGRRNPRRCPCAPSGAHAFRDRLQPGEAIGAG